MTAQITDLAAVRVERRARLVFAIAAAVALAAGVLWIVKRRAAQPR